MTFIKVFSQRKMAKYIVDKAAHCPFSDKANLRLKRSYYEIITIHKNDLTFYDYLTS